ncbi:MAG: AMP-binding protein [Verrucomicrobiota bacterium JB022]|nr:AMP-binding protein [Verrucomicrobiota bacterium JB022]
MSSLVLKLAAWGWTPDVPEDSECINRHLRRVAVTSPQNYFEQIVGSISLGQSVVLRPQGLAYAEDPAVEVLRDFVPPDGLGPCILIGTGGTSGQMRFAIHTLDTLLTAAEGYAAQFPHWPANHISPLPMEHVGGLMPVFRALAANGEVRFAQYKDWMEGPPPEVLSPAVVSLVPTQLHRLMDDAQGRAWLQRFQCILIGGAALEAADRQRARSLGLRLAPCYGMTETAAMITVTPPEAFLAGDESVGLPMPHARVTLLPPEQRIVVMGDMLCHGYWPPRADFLRDPFYTGDQGMWLPGGHLRVQGRLDRVVNTGGEKVDPGVVERRVQALPGVTEAIAFGLDDPDWGQRLVIAVAGELSVTQERVWQALYSTERRCEVPKELRLWPWRLPRTGTGKPNWRRLRNAFNTEAAPETEA